jgi:hypothetical protein
VYSEDGGASLSLLPVYIPFTSEPLEAKLSNHFMEHLVPDMAGLFQVVEAFQPEDI